MLLILAFIVGIGSGLSAVVLKKLIHLIGDLFNDTLQTGSGNILYLILPALGMFLSFLLIKYIIKDDIGHGVTKALHAISKNTSKIKAHNTWSSTLTSSLTIGFGGSVGTEAPIVYTGAAIGSNLAKLLNLPYKDMTILLGCGAAGAISGIFKAPLAGVLFTLEILMFNISMSSVLPLMISSVTATVISSIFMGSDVSLANDIVHFDMGNLPYYIILGVFCGFVSLYFTRTTLFLEAKIKKINNTYLRWAICGISLGVMIYLFPPLFGEGYKSLSSLLNGNPVDAMGNNIFKSWITKPWFIPIFFSIVVVLKVFAMSATNAGGGVGGTFGPTLIVGGISGFVLARFINMTGLGVIPETNYALVGMAGLMAGVMQAPMTAIFLIAEITGGYELLLPLIITSLVSYVTIHPFEKYSIYTKRLAQNGELLTHDSDKSVLTLLNTSSLVENSFTPIGLEDSLADLVKVVEASKRNLFPVLDKEGRLQGIILLDDIRKIMFNKDLYDAVFVYNIMQDVPDYVYIDEQMDHVMEKFERTEAWNLPVVDKNMKYIGFVSKSKIFSSYREKLHQISHD